MWLIDLMSLTQMVCIAQNYEIGDHPSHPIFCLFLLNVGLHVIFLTSIGWPMNKGLVVNLQLGPSYQSIVWMANHIHFST